MPDDTHVEIAAGETVTLELAELGSSGYLWDLDALDPSVVRVASRELRHPDPDPAWGPPIGGAAKLVLSLVGVAPGTAEAGMRRPWLPGADAAATLRVTCR